jgi:hypothetical protein
MTAGAYVGAGSSISGVIVVGNIIDTGTRLR